mmetsp:Transcript_3868/g.11192  ORF Transcript_3868/g.11192 Transcript_3868/m.11192 type:complete len:319 (-) Transcript_3868:579-1535(-)
MTRRTAEQEIAAQKVKADLAAQKASVKAAAYADTATEVLAALTEAERGELTDSGEVSRYVRATNGSKADALRRLRETFAWRRKERPESLACRACVQDPQAHYMHVVGHDSLGRPIIYSCLTPVKNRSTAENRTHMIVTFEQAIRLMPKGVEQWVWVSDFAGFGMSDVDPGMARTFLHVSAEYYPERLGHFVVLDAPSVFNVLYKIVKPWVDPATTAKITFVGVHPAAQMRSAFKRLSFSDELIDWLSDEIEENRNRKIVKSKVYSYTQLQHIAATPGEFVPGSGSGSLAGGHNIYGTRDFMDRLRGNPAALKPAAPAL